MPKGEAYACDAGCGATLLLASGDNLMRNGWYHTFTPVRAAVRLRVQRPM